MYDVARTVSLLHFQTSAVLSTHSKMKPGYPFGSRVLYDVSDGNDVVFFISTISEHYHNILVAPQISLFVSDPYAEHDHQKYARLTLLGDAVVVADGERGQYDESYQSRFPNAAASEIAHSFKYVKLRAESLRWIGGFGSMGWMTGEELTKVPRDSIAYVGQRIVTHMNLDHAAALPDLARIAGESLEKGEEVQMSYICSSSCELQIRSEMASRRVTIDFSEPCNDSTAVRKEIVSLLNKAREE